MRTTFRNGIEEAEGLKHLESEADTFRHYMRCQSEDDLDSMEDEDDYEELKQFLYDYGDFNDYGLGFSLVDKDTFDDQNEAYYRYQLSWGGPGDEIRFYPDGTIEYAFFEWFKGIGFDITDEDWAQWLKEAFAIDSLDWES